MNGVILVLMILLPTVGLALVTARCQRLNLLLGMQERQFSNEMRVLLNLPLSGWVGEATSQLCTRNAINTCNTNKFGSPLLIPLSDNQKPTPTTDAPRGSTTR